MHDALVFAEAALFVQSLPARRQPVGIFGAATAALERAADAGHPVHAGDGAAQVTGHDLVGAADGGVGHVPGAEHAAAAVHADLFGIRSADTEPLAERVSAADLAPRLGDGQHRRQVLGFAARHHRAGGHLLDGGRPVHGMEQHRVALLAHPLVGLVGQHLVGLVAGAFEHFGNPLFGGYPHRQTIGVLGDRSVHRVGDPFRLMEELLGLIHRALEDDPVRGRPPGAALLLLFGQRAGQAVQDRSDQPVDIFRSRERA